MLLRFLSRFFAVALLASGVANAQTAVTAGRDYNVLTSPQPTDSDGVEVLEFFAYGCIHCFNLEPALTPWTKRIAKDVKFRRVPTPFKIHGVDSPPIYYTLEAMGLLDALHMKIFEAIHQDNAILGNPNVFAQWLAKNGVDVKKYQEVEKSFSVQSKVSRAAMLTSSYKIESTPTLAVAGRFTAVSPADAGGGTPRLFQVVDSLIASSRQGKATPAGKS
jgi:thiol:disulfide interchange protein DsbA